MLYGGWFNLVVFNNCRGLLVHSQLLESSLTTRRTRNQKTKRLCLLTSLLDWSDLHWHTIYELVLHILKVAYRLSVNSNSLDNHVSMLSLHNGLTVSASLVSVCSSLPSLCHLVSQFIAFHLHQLEEGGSLRSPTSSCTPQTHVSCRNTSPGKRGNKVTHQVKYWSCSVCSLVNIALMSREETSQTIWCKFREEKEKSTRESKPETCWINQLNALTNKPLNP